MPYPSTIKVPPTESTSRAPSPLEQIRVQELYEFPPDWDGAEAERKALMRARKPVVIGVSVLGIMYVCGYPFMQSYGDGTGFVGAGFHHLGSPADPRHNGTLETSTRQAEGSPHVPCLHVKGLVGATVDPCRLNSEIVLGGMDGRHTDRRFFQQGVTVHDRMQSLHIILRFISEVLPLHGISYWLDGGSLLGALRNGRTLPWDPDADIAMTLESYALLQKACRCPGLAKEGYSDGAGAVGALDEYQKFYPGAVPARPGGRRLVQRDHASEGASDPEAMLTQLRERGAQLQGQLAALRKELGHKDMCHEEGVAAVARWQQLADHPVRRSCPGLSTQRHLFELDVTPYRVPGRITDTQTGFYADIFVFHKAIQTWEDPEYFYLTPEYNWRELNDTSIVGHVPDRVQMPLSRLEPLQQEQLDGIVHPVPHDAVSYAVQVVSALAKPDHPGAPPPPGRDALQENLSVPHDKEECWEWWKLHSDAVSDNCVQRVNV